MPTRPLSRALRRRERSLREEPGPESLLPRLSGVALRGSRQDGSPGVGGISRAGAGIRPPDDAGRLTEVRERAADLAAEPWHSDSAAERELRRYSLLLRDSAPPDQLA